jgi:hypothetical protein
MRGEDLGWLTSQKYTAIFAILLCGNEMRYCEQKEKGEPDKWLAFFIL